MSDNLNCTQVYVNIDTIKKSVENAMHAVLAKRQELKERNIKYLMQPYRYCIFWHRTRTREQAESFINDHESFWDDIFYHDKYFRDELLEKSYQLKKACQVCDDMGMNLSLQDAGLVNAWKNRDTFR